MLIRRVARPLLGSTFIAAGLEGLRDPGPASSGAEPVVAVALNAVPAQARRYLPRDPQVYVRAHAATQLIAGVAMASGKLPRVSALVLAGTLVPATVAGHPFWQEVDPTLRKQQRSHFWKNISLLGGLIIAGIDTEGRPGLSWRARHATRTAAKAISSALPGDGHTASPLADKVAEFSDATKVLADKAGERWDEVSETLGERATTLGEAAREQAPKVARYARKRGAKLAKAAQEQGVELADIASQRGRELTSHAVSLGTELADSAAKSLKSKTN